MSDTASNPTTAQTEATETLSKADWFNTEAEQKALLGEAYEAWLATYKEEVELMKQRNAKKAAREEMVIKAVEALGTLPDGKAVVVLYPKMHAGNRFGVTIDTPREKAARKASRDPNIAVAARLAALGLTPKLESATKPTLIKAAEHKRGK